MPTLDTDKYILRWKTNEKLEVNVEVNSVAVSDYITITNEHYLEPLTSTQVFQS